MAVSEATMREWAEVISENDFHEELINPNNGRSDAEMLARLMRAEEDNLDALAGVAQELLNRKRYRSVFGGDEMTWDTIGNYSTPWGSWREVIYADGQFSPIKVGDGAYNNHLANPMEIKAGENVATAPITSAWAKACELAYELTTMNTMYKSRINESTLVNDQLFHRGIGRLSIDATAPPLAETSLAVVDLPLALKINKVHSKTQKPLSGAGFQLKAEAALSTPLCFTVKDGVYWYDPDGSVTTIEAAGDNCEAFIYGIPVGKYQLEETVVPEHFFPAPPVAVEITLETTSETPREVVVTNTPQVKLGIDADRFNVVIAMALTLIIGSGVGIAVLVRYRRKRNS